MLKLCDTKISDEGECPYLPDRFVKFQYFFAKDLSKEELDDYLSRGWRKFGIYYFKPVCPGCVECKPIRIPVDSFKASKSQRRTINKCANIEVKLNNLEYSDEIFEIYQDHSLNRFGKESNQEEFTASFFMESCPTLQSEYYLDGKLIGVGFLDYSAHGLSSIYFIYRTEYSHLNIGTFSVLKEVEITRSMGLKYYYLGYYIEGNSSMAYKSKFRPYEVMNWDSGEWAEPVN